MHTHIAHVCVQGGWSAGNVVFLDGGYQQWRYQGLPCEASE